MAATDNSLVQTRVTTKGERSNSPNDPHLRNAETSTSQSAGNVHLNKAVVQTRLITHDQIKDHSKVPAATTGLERERDAADPSLSRNPRATLKDTPNPFNSAEETITQPVHAGNLKDFGASRDSKGQLTQPKGTMTDYDTDVEYLSNANTFQHLRGHSSSKPINSSLGEDDAKTYPVATSSSVAYRNPGSKGFPPLPTIIENVQGLHPRQSGNLDRKESPNVKEKSDNTLAQEKVEEQNLALRNTKDYVLPHLRKPSQVEHSRPSDGTVKVSPLTSHATRKERPLYILPHLRRPENKDVVVTPTPGRAPINKVESEGKANLPHLYLPQPRPSSYERLDAPMKTTQKEASLLKTYPPEALAASVNSPAHKTDVVSNVTNVSPLRPSKPFLGEHLLPTGRTRTQGLENQTIVENVQSGPSAKGKEIMYPPTHPASSMKPEQSTLVSFVSGNHQRVMKTKDVGSPAAIDQGQPAPLSAGGNEGSNKAHHLPALFVLNAIQSPARQNSFSSSVVAIASQSSDPSAQISELSAELNFEQHWQGRNASERSEVASVVKKQESDDENFGIIDDTMIEHQLAGWDGNFQPPPIEWNDRDMYNRKKTEHIEGIRRWVLARRQEHIMFPCLLQTVDNEAYTSGYALAIGETNFAEAPDEMAHFTIRNEDPFSMAHMNQTATQSAQNYALRKKGMDERKNAARDIRKAYRRELKRGPIKLPPNPHKPKANIYIRLAQPRDMGPVTQIYNYYVRHSVVVEELEPTEVRQWREILQQTLDNKFAFFVAVVKGGQGTQEGWEDIVGFAYAEPHTSEEQSSFGYFCEMQVYVSTFDEEHIHKGIGKSLVDRVLWSLDSTYHYRNGCVFVCDPKIRAAYECGGNLIQKNIMIKVPFDADDDSQFQWIKKWLEGFGFVHAGTLPRVGRKFKKQ